MNLNYIAPVNPLGYGVAGLNLLKSLCRHFKVSYFPIGEPHVFTHEDVYVVKSTIENAKFFDAKADCIRVWHQFDMSQFVGKGRHIGFPIFELDKFNRVEKHHLQSCDALFVCSKWAQQIIDENGITVPTYYVPLGYDPLIFNFEMSLHPDTIFFNCGKWEVRKGHDILAEAFTKAFKPTDNVQLWMMCDNPFSTPEEKTAWENKYLLTDHYRYGRIKLLPRVQSHREVADIMKQTDCGVFPSRGEGWNLEALEMLACGKDLIITDYSAHKEFANSQNAKLIPVEGTELAFDNKWFHGQGSWAKLTSNTVDILVDFMREIHKYKQDGADMINRAGIETAKQFTWDSAADKIKGILCPD